VPTDAATALGGSEITTLVRSNKARVTSGGGDDLGERRVDYDAPVSAASSARSMGSSPLLT
jgi:hypothetical protein